MKKLLPKIFGFCLNVIAWIAPRKAGRKGFYLFCTPFSAPLKAHQIEFLDTATKSTLKINDTTLQVYRWGNGDKVIVLFHGWQSHTFRWKNYIDALPKETYTIYALDAPGHGNSDGKYLNIPVYSQAIEAFLLTLPPIHAAVGHSLGTFALLYTHFRLGTLPIQRLVFMAPPGEAHEFVSFYRHVLGLSDRTIKEIRQSFMEEIGYAPEFFSASKFAADLEIPGIIIHDQHDDEAPYRHAVTLNKAWKNSRLVTTTGLGHNLRSAQTVKQVIDFIAEPLLTEDPSFKAKSTTHQTIHA